MGYSGNRFAHGECRLLAAKLPRRPGRMGPVHACLLRRRIFEADGMLQSLVTR